MSDDEKAPFDQPPEPATLEEATKRIAEARKGRFGLSEKRRRTTLGMLAQAAVAAMPPGMGAFEADPETVALAFPGLFALAIGLMFVGAPLPAKWSKAEAKRRRRGDKRIEGGAPIASPFDYPGLESEFPADAVDEALRKQGG